MLRRHGCGCPLASRVSRAVRVLAPDGAESDKHLFPESCLQDDRCIPL